MKKCSVKPYTGRGKYIFVSYCPKDKRYVFPMIEQMARDGYNIWYDDGIDRGTENQKIIDNYITESTICLAVISKNAINSHNCRKEINYAILRKKQFVSALIEPVELSLGMQLQLSSAQSIDKYALAGDREFFATLYKVSALRECYSEPDPSIIVSRPEDYDENGDGRRAIGDVTIAIFGHGSNINSGASYDGSLDNYEQGLREKQEEEKERLKAKEAERIRMEREAEEKAKYEAEEARRKAEAERIRKEQEAEAERIRKEREAEEERIRKEREAEEERIRKEREAEEKRRRLLQSACLVRTKTGEIINIDKDVFVLGRSETKASYTILGNSMIGREHARIVLKGEAFYIVDNNSLNKTHVNSITLEPDKEYELVDGDIIKLANELFEFHIQK